ncbi:hypothetical protein [Kineococcus radiotolerans]|nr:hypothetical protein [Kineococcus radiotolerans]
MHHDMTNAEPADPLRVVLNAHARTLATATARYSWRTPVEDPVHTSAYGHTDLTTGAATMTTVATTFPSLPPPAPLGGDGVLVLDGLIALPGQSTPEEVTAHALLVPEAGSLSMILLDGPPTQDDEGRWTSSRTDAPRLTMEVDPLLGSVAATFHWLAAVTSAEPDGAPGRYRVDLDLSKLVDDAHPQRREAVRLTLDQLRPGLSSGSASGTVLGIVEVDPASGLVTSFSVTAEEPDEGPNEGSDEQSDEGPQIDPILLQLREHGVAVQVEVPRACE